MFVSNRNAIGEELHKRGIYIMDATPSIHEAAHGATRGWEIHQWLIKNKDEHEITHVVIIDDDSDMMEWQADWFVKTSMTDGLTYNCAGQAINILNGHQNIDDMKPFMDFKP